VITGTAGHVDIHNDAVTGSKPLDFRSCFGDYTCEFMARDERKLDRRNLPLVDVNIGKTEAHSLHGHGDLSRLRVPDLHLPNGERVVIGF
jgi:hypothetical protein